MQNKALVLLSLIRQKKGDWQETLSLIGSEIMEEFENAGYILHIGNEWQINMKKRKEAIFFMFP